MKIWTQGEYDAAPRTAHGVILGTGDFRGIDFKNRHAVVIGAQSIIGPGANLGMNCEIGDRCDIGADLVLGAYSTIGENCHIGPHAMIGEGCAIGRKTCFATGCGIAPGVDLGDGVQLPSTCLYLFDYTARDADGRTLIKCVPEYGMQIYAFMATAQGRRTVYVAMRGKLRTLDEFEDAAADMACCNGMSASPAQLLEGQRVLATAKYIRALFNAEGLCERRRRV